MRWPAEYERQQAVLLSWPHQHGVWGADLARVQETFTALCLALPARLQRIIVCYDRGQEKQLWEQLRGHGVPPEVLSLYVCPSDDVWVRDYGPLSCLAREQGLLLNFRFDGWGGRYPADRDDQLSRTLHGLGAFGPRRMRRNEQVLEGGGVETDGQGTVISSRSYLQRSMPDHSLAAIRQWFQHHLGCHRLLLVEDVCLHGDDSDGHVDMLVRFASPQLLLYSSCDDPEHPDYPALRSLAGQLRAWRRADGARYRLQAVPVPPWRADDAAARNYVNFLISNDCVLMPCYDCPSADALAQRRVQSCFPGRRVAGIPCTALIRHGGGVHCVTLPLFAAQSQSGSGS